jgi:CheY-like chemotaxis protein
MNLENASIHTNPSAALQGPPAVTHSALSRTARQSEPEAPNRRTILLIDDDAELRSLLRLVFTGQGYDVAEAEDGQEGLETVLSKPFDLVLVDFDLPFIHGLEVVRELRRHPKFEALPIIMMTSHGNRLYAHAVDAGCDEFLAKPLDFDRLHDLLQYFAPVNAA